jgi:LacI family transcriptional regulator
VICAFPTTSLIGYDDIDFARSAVVPLSSIRQSSTQIGTAAIDLLAAVVDDSEPLRIV